MQESSQNYELEAVFYQMATVRLTFETFIL